MDKFIFLRVLLMPKHFRYLHVQTKGIPMIPDSLAAIQNGMLRFFPLGENLNEYAHCGWISKGTEPKAAS